MTYRIRNIGIAVALAIVAALLTTFYVTNYKRNVQQGEQKVPVYVASHDIPLGTPGSDIAHHSMLRVEHVLRRSVVPGAISQPDQIDKLVAVEPIYAGEQVSTRRFRTAQEQGIRAQLKGNLRAFEIAGSEQQLLAGTLKDGDRVDFVGNWLLPEGGQTHVSRVVLRDLLVLQAPETSRISSKLGSSPDQPFSTMLAVTDAQSEKLWWVAQNGKWSLELRAVTDAADSPDRIESANTVALDGLSARERKRARGGR
ncbi:MAG: Flp pilus assembly protein CpaB [Actinobacteria bacterium]|nr:MAG: Flp pilus assembly protein CpaB [Actinomycetota bacterium]